MIKTGMKKVVDKKRLLIDTVNYTRLHQSVLKELRMKRTFVLTTAAMMLAGAFAFAEVSTLIDFTLLNADSGDDGNGNPTLNAHTTMDYAESAGTVYTDEQKELMKTSLAIGEWEIVLNSSARNVQSVGISTVREAPVAAGKHEGEKIMGVRIEFPTTSVHSNAKVVPAFSIPAYEPVRSEEGGEGEEGGENSANFKSQFENGYGVVKNVGTLKSIAVETLGENFPHRLYVLLSDTDGVQRRYDMGTLKFDGWRTLTWNNPDYISEVRTREIRVIPLYPRGLPFVKFDGFQVSRDASDVGGTFIGYFRNVQIMYDRALLKTERDIVDEDLWNIIGDKEKARQNAEMSRFGNKQVNRYLEKQKMATETSFEEAGEGSEEGSSDGATTQAE